MSKPLTFGELAVGEHFIAFPQDGDDSGHGGYRGTSWVFEKIDPQASGFPGLLDTSVRLIDGVPCSNPERMQVLRVGLKATPIRSGDTEGSNG